MTELEELLAGLGCFAVAFSGGLDSSLLCAVGQRASPIGLTALTADTPFTPRRDIRRAREMASAIGFRHMVIPVDPLSHPAIAANRPERCYLCKKAIFEALLRCCASESLGRLLEGTNADDVEAADRPGLAVLAELGIVSPLAELGLGREDVVAMSRSLDLPDPERRNNACLATRVPAGTTITEELLSLAERAEEAIHALGFDLVRFRTDGRSARIELGAAEMESARSDGRLELIREIVASQGMELEGIAAYGRP